MHRFNAFPLGPAAVLVAAAASFPAVAQTPVSPAQQARAQEVASSGVALADLRADAPARYTVQKSNTLWGIAGMYLKSPWRWPDLWGMNLAEIRNPHRIYPGQVLVLEARDGKARLRLAGGDDPTAAPADLAGLPIVKLSPRTRIESLADTAVPTLKLSAIEPFLVEPMIVDEATFSSAARLVATTDSRVLMSRGDRAYARSFSGQELVDDPQAKQKAYRVFRNAKPLKDPITGEVLGYEAQYIGRALLVRSEDQQAGQDGDGKAVVDIVPATVDITDAKEELRVGDRLLPEPAQDLMNYVPRAPGFAADARVVSIYGSAVANAAQNQVVAINKGRDDGMEAGHVLALLRDGPRLTDNTDPARMQMKLPDERNGLAMVFRTFERVSYALVLDITSGVKVGDRLVSPR